MAIEAKQDVTFTNVTLNGDITGTSVITTSAGAGDSGKIVKLDSAGKWDTSVIPQTFDFDLGISKSGITNLTIESDAGNDASVGLGTRFGSKRWRINKSGPETGGDAGADLRLQAFNDSGSLIDTAFFLSRSVSGGQCIIKRNLQVPVGQTRWSDDSTKIWTIDASGNDTTGATSFSVRGWDDTGTVSTDCFGCSRLDMNIYLPLSMNGNSISDISNLTTTGTSTLPTVDIDGGSIEGTTIGGATAPTRSDGNFIDVDVLGTLGVVGAATFGSIDGTPIGGTTPAAGDFTTLDTTGKATFAGTAGINVSQGRIDLQGILSIDNTVSSSSLRLGAGGAITEVLIPGSTDIHGENNLYVDGNIGVGTSSPSEKLDVDGAIAIADGISAPSASTGKAKIYVDSADGDLKVKFADGTVKTIATDT